MVYVDILPSADLRHARGAVTGMTILLVTHDIGAISPHVTRVACLNGKIFTHDTNEISRTCSRSLPLPVDLIAHGIRTGCCATMRGQDDVRYSGIRIFQERSDSRAYCQHLLWNHRFLCRGQTPGIHERRPRACSIWGCRSRLLHGIDPFLGAAAFTIGIAFVIGTIREKFGQYMETLVGAVWAAGMAVGIFSSP